MLDRLSAAIKGKTSLNTVYSRVATMCTIWLHVMSSKF
jgi:hypothetical protein